MTGAIRRVVGGIAASLEARRAASRGHGSSFVVVVEISVLTPEGKPRREIRLAGYYEERGHQTVVLASSPSLLTRKECDR